MRGEKAAGERDVLIQDQRGGKRIGRRRRREGRNVVE